MDLQEVFARAAEHRARGHKETATIQAVDAFSDFVAEVKVACQHAIDNPLPGDFASGQESQARSILDLIEDAGL